MEDWNISILHFGNGHCEWKASNGKNNVTAFSLQELITKVREMVSR